MPQVRTPVCIQLPCLSADQQSTSLWILGNVKTVLLQQKMNSGNTLLGNRVLMMNKASQKISESVTIAMSLSKHRDLPTKLQVGQWIILALGSTVGESTASYLWCHVQIPGSWKSRDADPGCPSDFAFSGRPLPNCETETITNLRVPQNPKCWREKWKLNFPNSRWISVTQSCVYVCLWVCMCVHCVHLCMYMRIYVESRLFSTPPWTTWDWNQSSNPGPSTHQCIALATH